MARSPLSFLTLALALACSAPEKKSVSTPTPQAAAERNEGEPEDPEESETDQEAEEREAREEEERERQRQREREHVDRHLVVTLGAKPPWAALKDRLPAKPPLGPLRPEPPALPTGLPTLWKAGETMQTRVTWNDWGPYERGLPTVPGKALSVEPLRDRQIVAALDHSEGGIRFYQAPNRSSGRWSIATATRDEPVSFAFARELVEPDRVLVAYRSSVILAHPDVYKRRRLCEVGGTNIEPTQRYGLYGIDNFAGGVGVRVGVGVGKDLYLQWISGELAAHVSGSQRLRAWSLSESGKTLGLLHTGSETVEIIGLEQGRSLALFSAPPSPRSIAVSPNGHTVAVGGSSLILYSLRTGEEPLEDTSLVEPIEMVAFSPQGDLLLVSSGSAVYSYVLPETVDEFTKLPRPQVLHHTGNVGDLSLSADGRLFVSASVHELRTWSR